MGTITSGVGLISGINTKDLIDQLMQIEARPKTLIQNRNTTLTAQQAALQGVNAKLLALKLTVSTLTNKNTFSKTTASSSDESVLSVTTGTGAVPGTYAFTVARLVSTQQMISQGVADSESALSTVDRTLTLEFGDARLDTDTSLSQLNGGEGVSRGKIRITDRSGATAVVDLSKALSVNDVLDTINSASGVNVTASVDGDGLRITDNTGSVASNLIVANVGSTNTATSLGLAANVAADSVTGADINALGSATLLNSLRDGNGIRSATGVNDFTLTDDSGSYSVNLDGVKTLGQLFTAIQTASAGNITAAASGQGITLTGTGTVSVAAVNDSLAAYDLGLQGSGPPGGGTLAGSRLIAAINSRLLTSLDGGYSGPADAPPTLGTIDINGNAIDLSSAQSVSDILQTINDAAVGVTASLNTAGNGIRITHDTGNALTISDTTGNLAAFLNLDATFSDGVADSGNLQLRYINEATQLSTLNGGNGVARGQFRITDSSGASALVDLSQGDETTIDSVLAEINSKGLAINARVNDRGDGILLEDLGPGVVNLTVEDVGSTTARDLGILATAENPGDSIDGSFERSITLLSTDTLTTLADKINSAGLAVKASIINDGSGVAPYRLSLLSTRTGRAGSFVFDDGGADLGVSTLSQARDAAVFYGSADPARAIAITSPTNSLSSVVPGATITLKAVSDQPVQVTLNRDTETITASAQRLSEDFNSLIDTINDLDSYNAETEERGLLLGDPTLARIRSSLYQLINGRNTDLTSSYNSLTQVGFSVANKGQLEFDSAAFQAALAAEPDAVTNLFTFKETDTDPDTNQTTTTAAGIGVRIGELIDRLTDVGGALPARNDAFDSQIELNNNRIEAYDKLLAAKRARLEAQFLAMEKALAQLQGQSSALNTLSSLAAQAQASSA